MFVSTLELCSVKWRTVCGARKEVRHPNKGECDTSLSVARFNSVARILNREHTSGSMFGIMIKLDDAQVDRVPTAAGHTWLIPKRVRVKKEREKETKKAIKMCPHPSNKNFSLHGSINASINGSFPSGDVILHFLRDTNQDRTENN